MFTEAVQTLIDDMNKKQDAWVYETLSKNGINLPENPTHGDLFFAKELYKINVERHPDRIDLQIGGVLRGQWFTKYETEIVDNEWKLNTKCWN